MDEATEEERSIYYASLDKLEQEEEHFPSDNIIVEHDVGDEPEP